ncbi:MAG TPA: sigma-54 dependent transcriptional regulator [Pirellulales bacterium]|jgi:nitrogen regulation protein NR(I)|nr:sigma-54 dependent transcriptional regulator [Pirellulales bacterium]
MMATVLVIDDDRAVRHLIQETFKTTDIRLCAAKSAEEGLEMLERETPDAVLLDVMLPTSSGLDVFERIRQFDAKLPVIFITACGDSETAIEAIKGGAYDYLHKPLDVARVHQCVAKALEMRRLMHVPVVLPTTNGHAQVSDVLIGRSPQMLEVYKAIGRVAPEDVTVLITGESGTGKELIARAIYQHSQRARAPFLAVNCAAIHETLLESELFGHEKGSFTGADQRRIGKFEHCSGGTLFLDEVGDMSPMVQSKLLRVLQEQRFERVGGNQTIQTDTRVIAATNRDLGEMVAEGTFREDLFYRLNGFTIELPPLRDREGDVQLLIEHFLVNSGRKMKKDVRTISPEALELLLAYSWPGNVRELQSVIRQTILQTTGPVVLPEFLPKSVRHHAEAVTSGPAEGSLGKELTEFVDGRIAAGSVELHAELLELMERCLLKRVLEQTGGNQSRAAKILGITRASLRHKLQSLHLSMAHAVRIEDHELQGQPDA